jgi:hypothetical protein
MSARISELVLFSAGLSCCLGLLAWAWRHNRTWVAAAVAGIAVCLLTIVVTLRGYALMGGGNYGIDHRTQRASTTPGDVLLAIVAFLVPVLIYLGVRRKVSRR